MDSRRNKIGKIILQEQEEDDELFFILVPALYSCLYEEKQPVHTSSLSGAAKVKEILEGHESWSRVEFRMEPEIFRSISGYLRREHLLEGTSLVAVEEQLGMFMYMISHNASNQDLQKYFQRSVEAIHRKINEIFDIIPTLAQRFIKIPSSLQPHSKIVSSTRYWPYFQNSLSKMPNLEKKLFRMPSADAEIAALHKEWDDARCPICMDHPHNAVLLLCSSHDKGCRSYICDTSYRHSNCLDRFRKMKVNCTDSSSQPSSSLPGDTSNQNVAERSHLGPSRGSPRLLMDVPEFRDNLSHQHVIRSSAAVAGQQEGTNYIQGPVTLEALMEQRSGLEQRSGPVESAEASNLNQLMCPLCRGAVKGWKIIKDARQYLDEKPRSCSREECAFSGTYGALRRHARRVHPRTRPADVDPSRRRAWHRLENQREYGDIMSAIRSAMPGSVVLGDYVIEGGDVPSHEREGGGPSERSGSLLTTFFLFHMMNSDPLRSGDEPRGSSRAMRRQRRRYLWGENLLGLQYDDDEDEDDLEEEEVQRPRTRRRFVRSRSEERR